MGLTPVPKRHRSVPVDVCPARGIAHQRDRFCRHPARASGSALGEPRQKLPDKPRQDQHDEKSDKPSERHGWTRCLVYGAEALERFGRRERLGTAWGHSHHFFPRSHGPVEVTVAKCAHHPQTQERFRVLRVYLQ